MKIQRFTAASMKKAIDEVRRELGRDAVIVRSTPVADGVEVVAAVDYDQSLFAPAAAGAGTNGTAQSGSRPESIEQAASRAEARSRLPDGPLLDLDRLTPDRVNLSGESPAAVPATETARTTPRSTIRADAFARGPADRLDDVGAELRSLRQLVEQQLSGLAWRDLVRHQPHSAGVTLRLLQMGLAPRLAREIADRLPPAQDMDQAWRSALADLTARVPQGNDDILANGGVVALVGPTGVGKTTTIAKLAGAYVQRHGPGSVGLITTDDFRLGAHEQLLAFGRVLGIPVRTARDERSIADALEELARRSLVLIDTEGAGHSHGSPRERLAALDAAGDATRRYLLLPANAQGASLERTVKAFSHRPLDGCIVTKVDESGSLGEFLSTTISTGLPVVYVSDGQQVPDDLHAARAEDLVRRANRLLSPPAGELEEEIVGLAFHNVLASSHV